MTVEQVTFQEVIPEKVYVIRCKDCLYFTKSDMVPYMDGYCSAWSYNGCKEFGYCYKAMRGRKEDPEE